MTQPDLPVVVGVRIRVNGCERELDLDTRKLLVEAIREDLGLTGTHVGCLTGHCGACTVLLDGRAVKACTVLAVGVDGADLVTVEGLAALVGADLHPLQEAFWREHGLQCGYCTPGLLIASLELLRHTPAPSEAEIRAGLSGNLCRCTGYQNVVAAVSRAATTLAAHGAGSHRESEELS